MDAAFIKNNANQEIVSAESIVESFKYGKDLITVGGKMRYSYFICIPCEF